MVWRVPSREIGAVPYEMGLELPPEYLAHDAGRFAPASYITVLFLEKDPLMSSSRYH